MKLKFISLNVWQGGNLMENILTFLKQEDPDIISLQEVYNSHDESMPQNFRTLDVLKKELPLSYFGFSPAFKNTKKEKEAVQGNAVLSRFPISTTTEMFYDEPYKEYFDHEQNPKEFPFVPRNLQHCEIQLEGLTLDVFNTQGIWGTDGFDNARRLHMGNAIYEEVRKTKNVILAGDFNLFPDTKTMEPIQHELHNVFKNELSTSFNMKRKTDPNTNYATSVVDMMFVSQNIRVLEHSCPQVDISDHLPLVATLEIN